MGINGTVAWSALDADTVLSSKLVAESMLDIDFPDIDWNFLQSIYGWAALQYQGWARGQIIVKGHVSRTVILYTNSVLEFYVDGKSYFGGDYYGYRRAPAVLRLSAGLHTIDIRIVRDVRAMGGVGSPAVHIDLRAEISTSGLAIVEEKMLLPDMVEGKLVSDLASVPLRNECQRWLEILGIESSKVYKRENHSGRKLANSRKGFLPCFYAQGATIQGCPWSIQTPFIQINIGQTSFQLPYIVQDYLQI